jgi:hypothetical protein
LPNVIDISNPTATVIWDKRDAEPQDDTIGLEFPHQTVWWPQPSAVKPPTYISWGKRQDEVEPTDVPEVPEVPELPEEPESPEPEDPEGPIVFPPFPVPTQPNSIDITPPTATVSEPYCDDILDRQALILHSRSSGASVKPSRKSIRLAFSFLTRLYGGHNRPQ